MTLSSPVFKEGSSIPADFTCDGAGKLPPLQWSDPPPGTKSFVLVLDDPDAPGGTFRHWGVYDIPASTRSIAVGQVVGTEAVNDFGKRGYGAPCPPKAGGAHRYVFKLHAVKVERLGVPADAKVAQIDREAEMQLVDREELVGTYERQ